MNTKRSSILALSLLLLALGGCGAPEFPDGEVCPLIWTGELATSYASCRNVKTNVKTRTIPAQEAFENGLVGLPLPFYGDILLWRNDIEDWGKKHCK